MSGPDSTMGAEAHGQAADAAHDPGFGARAVVLVLGRSSLVVTALNVHVASMITCAARCIFRSVPCVSHKLSYRFA
jgi:hypothetical protein